MNRIYEFIVTSFGIIGAAILIAVVIIFVPWLTIWAINTLVVAGGVTTFHIPLTFWTWLAALLIQGIGFRTKS